MLIVLPFLSRLILIFQVTDLIYHVKARRAFWALKGIIRLQALIRGHLVRRQAVATLCSMLGIVKFQALIRGKRVRASDIGIEVQSKCNLVFPKVYICW